MRAAGLIPAVEVLQAADTVLDGAETEPAKRGRGRPKGAKNKTRKEKAASSSAPTRPAKVRPMREHVDPDSDVEMAGPVPVTGEPSNRSGPFDHPLPIPPIDVDGLHRVFTHDALVSFCLFMSFANGL
jgi:hypothetical protein